MREYAFERSRYMNGKNVAFICIHVSLAEIIFSAKLHCCNEINYFITF